MALETFLDAEDIDVHCLPAMIEACERSIGLAGFRSGWTYRQKACSAAIPQAG